MSAERTALHLRLGAGEPVELVPGASVGLTGPGAHVVWRRFAEEPGVARLLPDDAGPLHPGMAVGRQVADAVGGIARAALDRAVDLLELVGVPEPHLRTRARPAQLTALDRQRAQLALAIANAPVGVAAHDPTRGLRPVDAAALLTTLARVRSRTGCTLVIAGPGATLARVVGQVLYVDRDGRVRPQAASPRPDGAAEAQSSSST